jgi:ankyrin repeat protein
MMDSATIPSLLLPSRNNQLFAVAALIKAGANLTEIDCFGYTPLMCAAESGYLEVVKMLLEAMLAAKIDINTKNIYKCTALILAEQNDHFAIVECINSALIQQTTQLNLLSLGQPMNKNSNRATEYHLRHNISRRLLKAATDGDAVTLKALLHKGADANATTENGNTALMLAAKEGRINIVNILIWYHRKIKPISIHAANEKGSTALKFAAYHNHATILKALLKIKLDINAIDDNGYSALMIAVSRNNFSVVTALLAAPDILIDLRHEETRNTALLLAAGYGSHADIFTALIQAKANIHALNKDGNTALNLAKIHGHRELIPLIERALAEKCLSSQKISRGLIVNPSLPAYTVPNCVYTPSALTIKPGCYLHIAPEKLALKIIDNPKVETKNTLSPQY